MSQSTGTPAYGLNPDKAKREMAKEQGVEATGAIKSSGVGGSDPAYANTKGTGDCQCMAKNAKGKFAD